MSVSIPTLKHHFPPNKLFPLPGIQDPLMKPTWNMSLSGSFHKAISPEAAFLILKADLSYGKLLHLNNRKQKL